MAGKLLITADTIRHKYFAIQLLNTFPDVVWVIEPRNRLKYYKIPAHPLMQKHFEKLFSTEKDYFEKFVNKEEKLLKERCVFKIDSNGINSKLFLSFLDSLKPESILTYSVSIIGEKILSKFPGRIWNVHAGLVPYYCGSSTNLMPIIHKKIEYLGMTIHHITSKIDSGGVVIQGRPKISSDDDSHTIGCKNTVLASELAKKVIREFAEQGKVFSFEQDISKRKVYYKKDFNIENLKKMNQLIEDGIFKKYRYKKVDIVEW